MRPDVVVSHVSLSSAVILLVACLAGVPVRVARMWSEGDGRPDTRVWRLRRALLRRLLRQVATDVVGVTAAALKLAGPGDGRYRVLYNSVQSGAGGGLRAHGGPLPLAVAGGRPGAGLPRPGGAGEEPAVPGGGAPRRSGCTGRTPA